MRRRSVWLRVALYCIVSICCVRIVRARARPLRARRRFGICVHAHCSVRAAVYVLRGQRLGCVSPFAEESVKRTDRAPGRRRTRRHE